MRFSQQARSLNHETARSGGRVAQRRLVALLLSSSCLIPVAAHAQTVSAGEVSAAGSGYIAGATVAPSQKKVFKSGTTTRVLNRKLLEAAGPVAGAAQMLSYAPGVQVSGYGNTGSTKYTVTLNGVSQGWGGYGSMLSADGLLGVTLDGVPVVDPSTNLWQSNMIPQSGMIQSVSTTYGPGEPADRWYNNFGGGIEFTPLQPTTKPGGDINLTYGSYGQKNIEFDLRTGNYHGWSTILAGGTGDGNSFRTAPDGFKSPSENYSIYLKTVKTFSAGNVAFGGYFARSAGYRTPVIPTSVQPGVYTNGTSGTLYSQQSSGFYSAPSFTNYEKFDTDALWMVFGRENINLDRDTTLHNLTYFENFSRVHSRLNDIYSAGPQQMEYNNPHTDVIGDKLWLTEKLPFNTVDAGAYIIHDDYNTRNNFYNTANGGNKGVANIGGKVRSGYFSQTDVAFFLQDDIHPIQRLHITPGVRFVSFQTSYGDSAQQDFGLAPGAVLGTKCVLNGTSTAGNVTEQGSVCGAHVSRNGVEPSLSANFQVLPWMAVYGTVADVYRAPQVGGGGGLFQKINPVTTYAPEYGQYFDAGLKFHADNRPFLHHFLAGVDYFHLRYAKQSLSVQINGNGYFATGSSVYQGVNLFANDNPIYNLFVFANASFVQAKYQSYNANPGPGNAPQYFNGYHVPYVPDMNLNIGAYYNLPIGSMVLTPRIWYQYTGSQYLFDNTGASSPGGNPGPSNQKMAGYGTLNMSAKLNVPVNLPYAGHKTMDVSLTALNVTGNKYNAFEYISSGGYFGTSTSGYRLAYPGAPFTIYGSVGFHF